MKRTVIKIDEELCNGCGNCVSGCHEGALQLIDGKAVMISDLYCDGLGACIGECPVGAIELIEKETEPYNEVAVMERISPKGERVVLAHLKHLKDHGEMLWVNQGVEWLRERGINFDLSSIIGNSGGEKKSAEKPVADKQESPHSKDGENMMCGCPGSMQRDFRDDNIEAGRAGSSFSFAAPSSQKPQSELRQWPVQLHLLNPAASYFQGADVLLASDCSAFTAGNFHEDFLKNRTLAIACPKLDSNTESYVNKLKMMFEESRINTLTILMMEVPCCGGLLVLAQKARKLSSRNVPIKAIYLSVRGELLSEEWV